MAFQKVPAGSGLNWLTDAVTLIMKNPLPFALMGLVVAIVGSVPLVGIALLILGPALNGGIIYAAREQESGRTADFPQLFQAFKEEGKVGKMLLLCLPLVAALVILLVFGGILFGGALLGAAMSGGSNADSAVGIGLGFGALLFFPIALIVGFAAFALTFLATPRVMLESVEPMAAMKDSAQAVLANLGAALIYCLILLVSFFVVSLVLSLIPILGQLLVSTALVPISAVASYRAWRQVYRHDITQELPPATPPVPPSVEA